MKHYINQVESKDVKPGEILLNKTLTTNLLLFVSTGVLLIRTQKDKPEIEVEEGHFVLLPAGTRQTATAVTASHILYIQAGPLSEMIVNDPEWNPERPVVLPILPALAYTLRQIEYYQKEAHYKLN